MNGNDETKLLVGAVIVFGAVWFLRHRSGSTTVQTSSSSSYQIPTTNAVAIGYAQGPSVPPMTPAFPSNAADAMYVKNVEDNVNPTISNLLMTQNHASQMMGQPYFAGKTGDGNLFVADPIRGTQYEWNPATNSVVSGGVSSNG